MHSLKYQAVAGATRLSHRKGRLVYVFLAPSGEGVGGVCPLARGRGGGGGGGSNTQW